jgi:hypothetical protein
MSQIFHRSFNAVARASIYGAVLVLALIGYVSWKVNQSSYFTYTKEPQPQPVPFSHRHHTYELGIDCRYCHTSVENSWYAGIPATHTCMTCHSQVWTNASMLEPVRASYRIDQSIMWTRVNALPDFVYFNHSIHIHKGIGCTTCHGQIGEMPVTWREHTLYMRWCINCHKHPERYIRPLKDVFDPIYTPPRNQLALGRKLVKEYQVKHPLLITSCETCHR